MPFWDSGDPTRLENARFCRRRLEHFAAYCTGAGLEVRTLLYDFSSQPLLEGARSIPFPAGEFRKAEKVNRIINDLVDDAPDFFVLMDADLVIREGDYPLLVRRLAALREDRYYVCHVDDLEGCDGVDFSSGGIDEGALRLKPRRRLMMGDLGGLFIAPYAAMQAVGGFDPRFTVWGGEDNEAALRLRARGLRRTSLQVRPLHLSHPSMEGAAMGGEAYRRQVAWLAEAQRARPLDGPGCVLPPSFLLAAARERGDAAACGRLLPEDLDADTRGCLEHSAVHLWRERLLPVESEEWTPAMVAPLLLWRLLEGFEFYHQAAALLGLAAAPGMGVDGERFGAVLAGLYGGRGEVARLDDGFLATLAAFGLMERAKGSVWMWRGRLAVAPAVMPHLLAAIAAADDLPMIDAENLDDPPELALFDLLSLRAATPPGWRRERLGAREVLVPSPESVDS